MYFQTCTRANYFSMNVNSPKKFLMIQHQLIKQQQQSIRKLRMARGILPLLAMYKFTKRVNFQQLQIFNREFFYDSESEIGPGCTSEAPSGGQRAGEATRNLVTQREGLLHLLASRLCVNHSSSILTHFSFVRFLPVVTEQHCHRTWLTRSFTNSYQPLLC